MQNIAACYVAWTSYLLYLFLKVPLKETGRALILRVPRCVIS